MTDMVGSLEEKAVGDYSQTARLLGLSYSFDLPQTNLRDSP